MYFGFCTVISLFSSKEELEERDPDLLKLGLLYEVGVDTATVMDQLTFLSFQHKSLQEFASSNHLAKRLEKSIKEGHVAVCKMIDHIYESHPCQIFI